MWSRVQIAALTALLAALCFPTAAGAEPAPPAAQSTVLFKDVRIFDGKSGSLSAPANGLVRGNKIDKISTVRSRSTIVPVSPQSTGGARR